MRDGKRWFPLSLSIARERASALFVVCSDIVLIGSRKHCICKTKIKERILQCSQTEKKNFLRSRSLCCCSSDPSLFLFPLDAMAAPEQLTLDSVRAAREQ